MYDSSVTPYLHWIDLPARGSWLRTRYLDRPGSGTTIVLVHGLGNSLANFVDLLSEPALATARLLALDLPGSGETSYTPSALTMEALVAFVDAFADALHLRGFTVMGASMGGLVGLMLAERSPRVIGFANAEGNLAAEDCTYSRLAVSHTLDEFEAQVFPGIKTSARSRSGRGFAKYLELLERAAGRDYIRAYYDYSLELVRYSDAGDLLDRFMALQVPKLFIYGEANRHLSYLPRLRQAGVRMAEIPHADHFMFYDDPTRFAAALASV